MVKHRISNRETCKAKKIQLAPGWMSKIQILGAMDLNANAADTVSCANVYKCIETYYIYIHQNCFLVYKCSKLSLPIVPQQSKLSLPIILQRITVLGVFKND